MIGEPIDLAKYRARRDMALATNRQWALTWLDVWRYQLRFLPALWGW